MKILFDFEITGYWMPDTPNIRVILTELKQFIQQRVNVLEPEIQKFPNSFLVFNLMNSGIFKDSPHIFRVVHVSEDLEKKIAGCFTNQDLSYLLQKIVDTVEFLGE